MLARVAESIYWMSRYVERAENVARFIEVNLNLMLDLPVGSAQQWQPLVATTGDAAEFAKRYSTATQHNVIEFLMFDQENVNSIRSCLRAARENARSVREIISSEMWEQLNEFYLRVNYAAALAGSRTDPQDLLRRVRRSGHLFTGVTDATMTHNESWNFCRLGRMLERADKTSRILDVKYFLLLPTADDVGTTSDDIQWAAVLRSASAFEMYRKCHGRIAPERIVEFLLLEKEFPRASSTASCGRGRRCTPSRGRRPGCSGIRSNACSGSSAPSSRTPASRRSSPQGCTSTRSKYARPPLVWTAWSPVARESSPATCT